MAQLNSRGTLIRSRWDYFEHSNGFGFVYGSAPAGNIGAYFANNSTGATMIDIFALEWSSNAAAVWDIVVIAPPLDITVLTPSEIEMCPLDPNRSQLPGVLGMYTASASAARRIYRNPSGATSASLAPIAMGAFLTLPPGYAIAVQGFYTTGPFELDMTVWYQQMLDNVAPAP